MQKFSTKHKQKDFNNTFEVASTMIKWDLFQKCKQLNNKIINVVHHIKKNKEYELCDNFNRCIKNFDTIQHSFMIKKMLNKLSRGYLSQCNKGYI